jgi:hypothetical protein
MRSIFVNGDLRRLGLIASKAPADLPKLELPTSGPSGDVDLEPLMPPVHNQSSLGACASFAACEMWFEFFFYKMGLPAMSAAELAFYFWVRLAAGLPLDEDTGSSIADAARAAMLFGFAPAESYPYDIAKFAERPPAAVEALAALHKMLFSYVTPTIETIDASLNQGFPIVIGIQLTESFQTVGGDGIYIPKGKIIGGHGMGIIGVFHKMIAGGYRSFYKMRNHWGVEYGLRGNVLVPCAQVDQGLITEGITGRRTQLAA